MWSIQYILELIGTFSFAISGALAIQGRGHDWLAALFTGFVTAIGGGSLRDMLLGAYPLVWVSDINILYVIMAGVVSAKVFFPVLERLRRTLLLFDAAGIALFTIVGTEKALYMGVHPGIAIIMGVFTAVMGGVIRDTLVNEPPVIFRPEIYASACLLGAGTYVLLDYMEIGRLPAFLVAAGLILVIRLFSVRYHWQLPKFL
jgi:uncharacterized membrane protein YeiH